jgi:hypothetical protein
MADGPSTYGSFMPRRAILPPTSGPAARGVTRCWKVGGLAMDRARGWRWRLLVTLIGAVGFLGWLLAARFFPALATPFRCLAMVWFFGFGAARVLMDLNGSPKGQVTLRRRLPFNLEGGTRDGRL